MVVSLGPKGPMVPDVPKNPREDGLGSNPRCLRRDVNKFSIAGATAKYAYSLIMDNKDIDSFYNRYLGQPPLRNDPYPWGVSRRRSFLHMIWVQGLTRCICDGSSITPDTTPSVETQAA